MPAVVAQPSAGRRSLERLLRASSPSTFLDLKLWNLVAFAERLGVLAEMALRLTVTLFTRLEPEHQQRMGVVPLATDLPVAAPADARDRNARSCRHTRLPQGRACART